MTGYVVYYFCYSQFHLEVRVFKPSRAVVSIVLLQQMTQTLFMLLHISIAFIFVSHQTVPLGFPGGASGKEPTCQSRRHKRCGFNSRVRKIHWRRAQQPTPVFLPRGSHGQTNLTDYSPQAHKESDTAEETQHAGTHRLIIEEFSKTWQFCSIFSIWSWASAASSKNQNKYLRTLRYTLFYFFTIFSHFYFNSKSQKKTENPHSNTMGI